eukprot:5521522-Pleurochrysis_carterae.AAC.2
MPGPPGSERRAEAPRYKTLDKDEARRGREETTISLRKDKRNEQLQKKRFGGGGPGATMHMPGPETQSVGSQAWAESEPLKLVEGVHCDDPATQLNAVTQFRKLLSIERSPPIEEVIRAHSAVAHVQLQLPISGISGISCLSDTRTYHLNAFYCGREPLGCALLFLAEPRCVRLR